MNKLSVIIPTFNEERNMTFCIKSLKNKSYRVLR